MEQMLFSNDWEEWKFAAKMFAAKSSFVESLLCLVKLLVVFFIVSWHPSVWNFQSHKQQAVPWNFVWCYTMRRSHQSLIRRKIYEGTSLVNKISNINPTRRYDITLYDYHLQVYCVSFAINYHNSKHVCYM